MIRILNSLKNNQTLKSLNIHGNHTSGSVGLAIAKILQVIILVVGTKEIDGYVMLTSFPLHFIMEIGQYNGAAESRYWEYKSRYPKYCIISSYPMR